MREQMADGRPRRPGRLVEVDGSLLGGDERRECRGQLRHRGPAEHAVARAVRRERLAIAKDADSDRRRGPVLDLPQRPPLRSDTSEVKRQLVPAESPFAATVGYSRAVRVGPHVHVAGTAPIMPGGRRPARGRVRAGEALPRDRRSRRSPSSAQGPSTSSAHASTSSEATTGRRSAAPTARSSAPSAPRPPSSSSAACSIRAGASSSRPRRWCPNEADLPAVDHRQGRRSGRQRARPQLRRGRARTRSGSRRSTCSSTARRSTSSSTSRRCSGLWPGTSSSPASIPS